MYKKLFKIFSIVIVMSLTMLLAGCDEAADVTIGSMDDTEDVVVGYLVSTIITGSSTIEAECEPAIGDESDVNVALEQGEIDAYGKFTGQNVEAIISNEALQKHPEMAELVEPLNDVVDQNTLDQLVDKVDAGEDAEEIVIDFLQDHKLVGEFMFD